MGVYIKGMEMPKGCNYCRFCFEEDVMFETEWKCDLMCKYFSDDDEEDRPDWCPLVEVPEPHGRLIEAPDVSEYVVFDEDTGTREISLLGLMECHRMVENATTVIEAEGE